MLPDLSLFEIMFSTTLVYPALILASMECIQFSCYLFIYQFTIYNTQIPYQEKQDKVIQVYFY